jgi:hypothetical protein
MLYWREDCTPKLLTFPKSGGHRKVRRIVDDTALSRNIVVRTDDVAGKSEN